MGRFYVRTLTLCKIFAYKRTNLNTGITLHVMYNPPMIRSWQKSRKISPWLTHGRNHVKPSHDRIMAICLPLRKDLTDHHSVDWKKVHAVKDKYCTTLLQNSHVNFVDVSLKKYRTIHRYSCKLSRSLWRRNCHFQNSLMKRKSQLSSMELLPM